MGIKNLTEAEKKQDVKVKKPKKGDTYFSLKLVEILQKLCGQMVF